jgi:ATP-dependent Clp protease adaptor protein ClpS
MLKVIWRYIPVTMTAARQTWKNRRDPGVSATPDRHTAAPRFAHPVREVLTLRHVSEAPMTKMADRPGIDTKPRPETKTRVKRPPLYKVLLLNDDFTPRDFVVRVLKAEFRMTEDQAHRVMVTAHTKGSCVVAVFTQEVAETKATRATDMARKEGFPLLFTTEPEE